MPDLDPTDPPPVVLTDIPCRHLRTKSMYVYTDGGDGDDPHGDPDNAIFWCLRTMKNFGPDDDHVNGLDCHNAARSCYEPT